MSEPRVSAMAEQLAAARRKGERIALDDPPRDFEEGFAVQNRVAALLGEPVIGWKVIEVPSGPVIFAPLLASGQVPAGGVWKVPGGEPAGIELEIAFRMARDVPAKATPDQIVDAIGSAHVVFELCQSRMTAPESRPRHVVLADFILNSGIVVGAEFKDWRNRDLRNIPGRLLVDGNVHKEGKSVDPMRALQVLAPALADHGKALKAGHVVITGSLIGMNWLTGQRGLRGEIDGCGSVEARLDAA